MADVSVILPTYNEVGTIHTVISSLQTHLDGQDYEIVVVDDDSPDGTATQVQEVFGDHDRVELHVRTDASGLASAVLDGMGWADGDRYVVMDADLQHPPETALALLKRLETGADMVIGSRHVPTGRVEAEWPLRRRVTSWGATVLAKAAVPPARDITDPMSGLFAVRAEIVESVRSRLDPHGYKIMLELLARCPMDRVVEHGYTFKPRHEGASNLGLAEYGRYIRHLAALTLPSRRGNRPAIIQPAEVSGDVE